MAYSAIQSPDGILFGTYSNRKDAQKAVDMLDKQTYYLTFEEVTR